MSAASTPKSFIIVPARLASTRLPRKLLLRETGKTVLQHTYEAARRARPRGFVRQTLAHERDAVRDVTVATARRTEIGAHLAMEDFYVSAQEQLPQVCQPDPRPPFPR